MEQFDLSQVYGFGTGTQQTARTIQLTGGFNDPLYIGLIMSATSWWGAIRQRHIAASYYISPSQLESRAIKF